MNDSYAEELRAHLGRSRARRRIEHDRDVARLLAPWRRHGAGGDSVVRHG
jgi:hypothetical protein